MKIFGKDVEGYPRTLIVLVAVLLVTSGLCGLTIMLQGNDGWESNPKNAWETTLIILGLIEYLVIAACIGGIFFVCLIWIFESIYDFVKTRNNDKKAEFVESVNFVGIVKDKEDESK